MVYDGCQTTQGSRVCDLTNHQTVEYSSSRGCEPTGGAVAQKTPAQALADIKGYTSANRIFVTSHAQMRLRQRGLTAEDLRSAIRSATSAEWREEDKAWRVSGGKDLDNEETIFGAALEEPGVRITTIF